MANKHKYRISNAALGKIIVDIIERTRSTEISKEQFHDTVFAAYNYIESESLPAEDADINPNIWAEIKERIDVSAKRSAAARERAELRRKNCGLIAAAGLPVVEKSKIVLPPASEISDYHREFLQLERDKFELEREKYQRDLAKEKRMAEDTRRYLQSLGMG